MSYLLVFRISGSRSIERDFNQDVGSLLDDPLLHLCSCLGDGRLVDTSTPFKLVTDPHLMYSSLA